MIYLFCFFVSCLLIWLGENNRKYFIISKAIFLLALIIPATLAGLRDFSVGYDVLHYGNPFFRDVITSPSLNAVSSRWDGWIEPGYRWLNFIVAKFTDDVRWFYFWLSFLQNTFTFFGFYTYRNKLSIWLGMLCYYCLFFNFSLNVMRESLAMSMLFFASKYLLNKCYVKYAIWILIALFFHKAAAVAFLFIPLHIYIYKFKSDRAKFILVAVLAITFFVFMKNLSLILTILQLDYLGRIMFYIAGKNDYELLWKLAIVNFILVIPPFAFFYWKRKELYSLGEENHFFFAITIICLLLTQMIHFGGHIIRVQGVFQWIYLLALLMLSAVYKNLPNKQFLLKTSIICYVFCRWVILVRRNTDETFPYSSSILSSIF